MSESIKKDPLSLLAHQVDAIAWAKMREEEAHLGISGGILYLTMGLGKTVIGQSIACDGINLFVVPKPLVDVHKQHLADWFPDRKVCFFHKEHITERRFNNMTFQELTSYDIVITTYDVVLGADRKYKESESICVTGDGFMKDKVIEIKCRREVREDTEAKGDALLYKINWKRLITDESHKFCNHNTKTFKAVMALSAKHRWVMSGSIIRNKDTDLWALLRFIGYNRTSSAKSWNDRVYRQHELDKVILQMDYNDAKIVLPERHNHDVPYVFGVDEQRAYDTIKKRIVKAYNGMMLGNVTFMHVLALFTRLRQMCISPHLITPEAKRGYRESNSPVDAQAEQELEEATQGLHSWIHDVDGTAGVKSSKIQKIIEIIRGIPLGEKIIVFSMFSSALDLIERAIEAEFGSVPGDEPEPKEETALSKKAPFTTAMLDGETKHRDRVIDIFKNDKKCRILLATSKVGGEGFTLTAANHVIQCEPWWTPSVGEQNFSRIHRYGQLKECHLYNLYAQESIEDIMVMGICGVKKETTNRFFGGAVGSDKPAALDKNMMARLLGL